MIDTNKLLDGLKECYDESNGQTEFFINILWNIAKGNWDAEIRPKFIPSPDKHWCFCCVEYSWFTKKCIKHQHASEPCNTCKDWVCVNKYS